MRLIDLAFEAENGIFFYVFPETSGGLQIEAVDPERIIPLSALGCYSSAIVEIDMFPTGDNFNVYLAFHSPGIRKDFLISNKCVFTTSKDLFFIPRVHGNSYLWIAARVTDYPKLEFPYYRKVIFDKSMTLSYHL